MSAFARDGGLLSYGANAVDEYRRAATCVDRILRGAKPVISWCSFRPSSRWSLNLKTAKTLGLTVPSAILLRADEMIE